MASRYVPCRDLEHVLEMYNAGLLCVLHPIGLWYLSVLIQGDGLSTLERWYGKGAWIPEAFAYLVEED